MEDARRRIYQTKVSTTPSYWSGANPRPKSDGRVRCGQRLRQYNLPLGSKAVFDSYRNNYDNVRMKREDGILEVALHSEGGPLVFNGYVHEALVRAFRDIGDDSENHVVILTGTGDEFCAKITSDGFDFFTPTGYDKILREGTKVLENILDIQVPMIAAINGPVTVHSEYALLCDIVIATEDAYFQDAPHPAFGIVPGDGLQVVWPEVIGEIRGRYFLLSGQKLSAAQAKDFGAVNEVVSREALLPRAWELARHMNTQSALTLRYTRMALSTRFRRRLQEGLSYGLALEGISAAHVARLNAEKAKG
jgi:enoyl-CoA hydratase/carnithine racemase